MDGKCIEFPKDCKNRKKLRLLDLLEKKKVKEKKDLEPTPLSPLCSPPRSSCSFHMDERGLCLNSECDSEPDRSNPLWKIIENEPSEKEGKVKPSENNDIIHPIWEEIMMEYEDQRLKFENLQKLSKPFEPPLPVCSKLSAVQYLEKYIFPVLCPVLEETLLKAKKRDCLLTQKSVFNGLDYISELLWNRNPMHPSRRHKYRKIFDIPFVIIWLNHHPRPVYPLSWVWNEEKAITVMQSYIRRYLVCKTTDCSEMRLFWKSIKEEREEEKLAERLKLIERLELLFNEILDKLIDDAVYESEWKIHGCHCAVKTYCVCVCKCFKWCKCCNCYKKTPDQDEKSYEHSKSTQEDDEVKYKIEKIFRHHLKIT